MAKLKTLFKFLRPRYLFTSLRGTCTLCGNPTLFILTEAPETIRNHAVCFRCGSSSRHRHLALCVQREFASRGVGGLSDLMNHPGISVLNASTGTPVARMLGKATNIICSEYFEGVAPGAFKDGIRNEDLANLSMPDASLDLILTEDVFEHIPDWRRGFQEVHRVLKPGGYHIFSIPYFFDRKTRELFRRVDGKAMLEEPIEYHGDPIRGQIPAFMHYGYDLPEILTEMGFDVRIEISQFAECRRYGTWNSFTIVTRKR